MAKGKMVAWPRKGVAILEDFEVGEPDSSQVLVKSVTTRLIGTDVACFYALPNTPPALPGYVWYSKMRQGIERDSYYPHRETSGGYTGIVAAVGDKATELEVGDRVYSSGPHASHMIAAEDTLQKIPNGISFDEASFMNYFRVALYGIRKALIELGESVAVFGLGVVGLASIQLSRLSGGRPVIGVDMMENRLEVAKQTGADYVFNPKKVDVVKEIQNVTPDNGANVVIDATGFPDAIPTALQSAAMYGRVTIVGSPRGSTKEVDFYRHVHVDNVVIIGAHGRGAYVDTKHDSFKNLGLWTREENNAMLHKFLADGEISTKEFAKASLKLSYERAQEAYEVFHKEKDHYLCTLLDWSDKVVPSA